MQKTPEQAAKIKASRQAALTKIKEYLDKEEIESQFSSLSGDYHSRDKFIFTWNGYYKGMYCEFGLHKVDASYSAYAGGTACIYAAVSLFIEKQLDSFKSFELGLVTVGLKLCNNKTERNEFFQKYAVPYNARAEARNKARAAEFAERRKQNQQSNATQP